MVIDCGTDFSCLSCLITDEKYMYMYKQNAMKNSNPTAKAYLKSYPYASQQQNIFVDDSAYRMTLILR